MGRNKLTIDYIKDKLLNNKKITKEGCWIWKGEKTYKGYGRIYFDGKSYELTRFYMSLFHNFDLNSELLCLHKCDNPSCYNPEHIFYGNQSDNMQDCVLKGRHSSKYKLRSVITHCINGHEYTKENTFMTFDGHRQCRICIRAKKLRYIERHKNG